jgi:hypothetical protein
LTSKIKYNVGAIAFSFFNKPRLCAFFSVLWCTVGQVFSHPRTPVFGAIFFSLCFISFSLFDLTNLSNMSKRKAAATSNSDTSVAEPLLKRAKIMQTKASSQEATKDPVPGTVDEPAAPQIESKPLDEKVLESEDDKKIHDEHDDDDDVDGMVAVQNRLASIGFPELPCICRIVEIESVFRELQPEKGNRVRCLREQGIEDGQIRIVLLYFGWTEEANAIEKEVGTKYLHGVMRTIYIDTCFAGCAEASEVFEHCDDDLQGNANWIVLEYLDREGYVFHKTNLSFIRALNKAYDELMEADALAADQDNGPPETEEKTNTTPETKDTKETKEAKTKAKEENETAEMVETEKTKTTKQATKAVETEKMLEAKRQLTREEDLLP